MQIIKPDDYYKIIAYYLIACEAQNAVRDQEENISKMLNDKNAIEKISDKIYDPSTKGKKKEIDNLLLDCGIMVEWKPAQNKFSKENKEDNQDVSQ